LAAASTTRGKYAVLPQQKEPGDPDERLVFLIEKAKSFFPKEYYPLWNESCNRLAQAGYGTLIPLSYARHSPKLVKLLNSESAINLAATVSLAAIKVNRATAELLPKAAVIAAHELGHILNMDHDDFSKHWVIIACVQLLPLVYLTVE